MHKPTQTSRSIFFSFTAISPYSQWIFIVDVIDIPFHRNLKCIHSLWSSKQLCLAGKVQFGDSSCIHCSYSVWKNATLCKPFSVLFSQELLLLFKLLYCKSTSTQSDRPDWFCLLSFAIPKQGCDKPVHSFTGHQTSAYNITCVRDATL